MCQDKNAIESKERDLLYSMCHSGCLDTNSSKRKALRRGNMKALRGGLEGIPPTKRPESDGKNRREGSE